MKRLRYLLVIMAASLPGSGCNLLEVEPAIMTEDSFYTSREKAQLALNGVYGALNSWELYGANLILDLNYNCDLCHYIFSTNASTQGASFELTASSKDVYDVWRKFYEGVRNANAFLEKIVQTDYDPDGSMQAQARFLRAWYYFVLAENFVNVPLRTQSTDSYEHVKWPASGQLEVMTFAVSEIEKALPYLTEELTHAPSDVTRTTAWGILARIYLYMAGPAVKGGDKHAFYGKAAEYAKLVIDSGLHHLNPQYEQIFINLISDKYDTEYRESMWEADFLGDRSSPDYYGNSRWGDINGIRSSNAGSDFASHTVNFMNAHFVTTLKIWDLYMTSDRTPLEKSLSVLTDKRQIWNIPLYHYDGSGKVAFFYPFGGDPGDRRALVAGVDKTPWYTIGNDPKSTNEDPLMHPADNYIGTFRREAQYEGLKLFKSIWNGINVPLLRYADVLLMYAEAMNEYNGGPSEELYEMLLPIRERAGIQTPPYEKYATQEKFRQFIRNERARELPFEGRRKQDLIRWGIYLQSMKEVADMATLDMRWYYSSGAKLFVRQYNKMSGKDNYLPIPALELAVNTEIRQNPLW